MEVKQLMIQMITHMNSKEIYEFVNLFPFLIDQQALEELKLVEDPEPIIDPSVGPSYSFSEASCASKSYESSSSTSSNYGSKGNDEEPDIFKQLTRRSV
tara:strand:- start:457 stop:753 length:297 start_codon:yes stop_codon:yes gene_type:complete